MRNVLCGLLPLLALGSASNAAPGDVLYVQASTVNVRQFPSLEAAVLTRLRRGSKVVEVRREGDCKGDSSNNARVCFGSKAEV